MKTREKKQVSHTKVHNVVLNMHHGATYTRAAGHRYIHVHHWAQLGYGVPESGPVELIQNNRATAFTS